MLGWGIALMVIGALSFILPLFGRQFIVVSLLGLTGMGSAVAGIVLFIVGVVLFNKAREKERTEDLSSRREVLEQVLTAQIANQVALQERIAEMEVKARSVDLEETINRVKEHLATGVQFPEALRRAIPGIFLAHVAVLSSKVDVLKASGSSEDEALRAVLKDYLIKTET